MSPLFFVRGGDVEPYDQRLWYVGRDGHYWSSRAYSSTTYTYDLGFNSSGVYPSGSNYRYNGTSLRCLIPTT